MFEQRVIPWGAMGVIIPLLVGVAFAVLTFSDLDAYDGLVAKICFIFACLVGGVQVVLLAARRRGRMSYVAAFLACGVIGLLGLVLVNYVTHKQESRTKASADTVATASPEPESPEAKPNIIVTGYRKTTVRYNPATQLFSESPDNVGMIMVVAQFRNAHEPGKEITAATDIRARIGFEPFEFYQKLDRTIPGFAYVHEGVWLNDQKTVVEFARGETKTLIVAIESPDGTFGGFDGFERGTYKVNGVDVWFPKVPVLTANKYVVKVEITGGDRGNIADLHHFTVTLRPEFNISFP